MPKDKLYEQRIQRMLDVAHGKIPDRVPICALMETFTLAYAGTNIEACNKSIRHHVASYGKIYEDIYYDSAFVPYMTHSLELGHGLGSDVFFASDDGISMQHKEDCPMIQADYDALIADPLDWIFNEFLPRKFPKYDTTNEEQLKSFLGSLIPFAKFAATMFYGGFYFKNKLNMPVVVGGSAEMPMDMIFDYLRGFRPTINDIRRVPDKVEAAANGLLDYCIDLTRMTNLMMGSTSGGPLWMAKNALNGVVLRKDFQFTDFPWIFNPCHIPPFISPAQFERFYWPTFKAMITYVHEHGGHTLSVLEGEWGPNLERLKELPDNSVTFVVENDDPKKVKNMVPNNSIMAGLPLDLLRDGTREECIAAAKKMIDECAPGGRFIFCTGNKVLLCPSDAQAENIRAVNEFVHGYGLYY